jgi:chemotaxis regulatin CheY-phosphate phosphatase CheZ
MATTETIQVRIQREIAELTQSIATMISSFKNLHRPLLESRETVPQATTQLDKITQQTEAVTTRMLDVVEEMTQREEEIIRGLDQIRAVAAGGSADGVENLAQGLIVTSTDNLNAAYQIMESLQFQDITAQQMDHAASLLEDVEMKLHGILTALGAAETAAGGSMSLPPRKKRAYDPHADFVDRKTDQKDIDSLFANKVR